MHIWTGKEGKARGPHHCSSAIGFTFWKGKFMYVLSFTLFPLHSNFDNDMVEFEPSPF